MRAYIAAYDGAEWCTLIHGETRGKAKYRFLRCEPSGEGNVSMFTEVRLTRLPGCDNQPFTDETIKATGFKFSTDETPPGYIEPFVNDCDCWICKEEHEPA
jgi:hypothetical protein